MKLSDLPCNLGFHSDENLRDVPDDPADMARAAEFLQEQLDSPTLDVNDRGKLLGWLGVFLRMLGHLAESGTYLRQAVELAEQSNDDASAVQNRLRLAHVYQWQQDFGPADEIYRAVIARCETEPNLRRYLDFALQHYGKSLFDQQRFQEAATCFRRALELRLPAGNAELIASTRFALESTERHLAE